jgi:hypothetical protein
VETVVVVEPMALDMVDDENRALHDNAAADTVFGAANATALFRQVG